MNEGGEEAVDTPQTPNDAPGEQVGTCRTASGSQREASEVLVQINQLGAANGSGVLEERKGCEGEEVEDRGGGEQLGDVQQRDGDSHQPG